MFREELEAFAFLVARDPNLGRIVRGRDARRILLAKTRYHLYFRAEDDDLVVLAIWHARRGDAPPVL